MIMWFMFFEQIPFENIPLQHIIKYIVNDKSRPKIQEDYNILISQLIRACWQNCAEKRPDLLDVLEFIERIIANVGLSSLIK